MPVDLNASPSHDPSLNNNHEKFEWHIKVSGEVDATQEEHNSGKKTAIALLISYAQQQNCHLSTADFKKAINQGALWLTPAKNKKQTQRLRRVKKTLTKGDELHFYYDKNVLASSVPDALLIQDFIDYSVWYKPYGMLSQGSKWSDHCTITRFAQQHLPNERQCFIVHRLDRAATGLIIIAHTKKAARALSAMFEHHQLEKYYQIIVHGDHQQRPQPDIIDVEIDGKKSRSTFHCLKYDSISNRSLVKVKIDSGRKHQIRKHAASINMPVVGDRLHGIADASEQLNLQLCAVSLRFDCPLMLEATKQDSEISKSKESKESKLDNSRFIELTDTLKPQL